MTKLIIIGGLAKAGTTSIFDYLNDVLNLKQPIKELGLFYAGSTKRVALSTDGIRSRKVKFQRPNSEIIIDASPHYLHDEHFKHFRNELQALKHYGVKVQVIIIIRDPIDRIISQYSHHKRDNAEPDDISNLLSYNSYSERQVTFPNLWTGYDYIGNSKYVDNLKILRQLLTNDELLVLDFKNLTSQTTLIKLHDFLGINQHHLKDLPQKNFSGKPKNIYAKLVLNSANKLGNSLLTIFESNEKVVKALRSIRSLLHKFLLSSKRESNLLSKAQVHQLKSQFFSKEYEN